MFKIIQSDGDTEIVESSALCARGTAGETISLTFTIAADQSISELTITGHSTASTLSASEEPFGFEIFIVHCWTQAGVGIYQAQAMSVEELLLKDDRISLKDDYQRTFKHWRHIYAPFYLYRAPVLPEHDGVRTNFKAGQTKKMFARIKLPANAKPGRYQNTIVLQANNNFRRNLPLQIDVLPYQLLQPPQEFFLWYKGSLDWRSAQHYVPESIYRLQLQDIFDHGFTSVSISETDTELAQRAIDIIEEIGFDRFIVLVPPFPELKKLRFGKTKPLVYLSDELDIHTQFPGSERPETLIDHHRLNWRRARELDAKTMSSLTNHTFLKRFRDQEDIGHLPEIISLYLDRNRESIQFAERLAPGSETSFFYYWQCHMEKRNLNRALAGVYLWKCGAAGVSPYCYQHLPAYPNSPFDDFDQWEPDFHVGGITRPFKDHMTTYPARNGVMPTLQWEGLREGITDFRYLYTLHHWLEKVLTSQNPEAMARASQIQKRVNEFLSRINLTTIEINSESEIEPYPAIKPHEYNDFRNQMIDDIQTLVQIVDSQWPPGMPL